MKLCFMKIMRMAQGSACDLFGENELPPSAPPPTHSTAPVSNLRDELQRGDARSDAGKNRKAEINISSRRFGKAYTSEPASDMASMFTGRRGKIEGCRVSNLHQQRLPFSSLSVSLLRAELVQRCGSHVFLKAPASKRQVGEFAAKTSDMAVVSAPCCSVVGSPPKLICSKTLARQGAGAQALLGVRANWKEPPPQSQCLASERPGPWTWCSSIWFAWGRTDVVPFCSCALAFNGPQYDADPFF